jgi:pyruvate formate lyase activating enzyme
VSLERTTNPQQAPTRRIASWHPATIGQWPGRVAAVIELWGCSFTCEGCRGARVRPSDDQPSWTEIVAHIHNHGRMLDSVIVTGGEPLEDPDLPSLLAALSELGLDVLLETNGSRPDVLSYLLAEDLVDGVALDVKAVPARYRQVSPERDMAARVAECADMLIASGVGHEFRTVLRPGLVTPEDIASIARTLQGGQLYALARGSACDLSAGSGFDDAALRAAARAAERFLPTVVRDLEPGVA